MMDIKSLNSNFKDICCTELCWLSNLRFNISFIFRRWYPFGEPTTTTTEPSVSTTYKPDKVSVTESSDGNLIFQSVCRSLIYWFFVHFRPLVCPWWAHLRGRVWCFINWKMAARNYLGRRRKLGVPSLHPQQNKQVQWSFSTPSMVNLKTRTIHIPLAMSATEFYFWNPHWPRTCTERVSFRQAC